MTQQIRVVIESLNDAGEVTGKEIIITKSVVKPNNIIDLGFRHSEQIDLLRHIQQQLLDKQSVFLREDLSSCPKCSGKLYKSGYIKSDFHSVFTDHKVSASRQICKLCKWASIPSVRSLFGNASHPDLVKVQCELGANHTFRDSQKIMNLLANTKRSTNNHDKIKRMTETVGQHIAEHPDVKYPCNNKQVSENQKNSDNSDNYTLLDNQKINAVVLIQSSDIKQVEHLYIQVDGGHVTTVEKDKRSFEVMTSVVFDAKNIEHTGGKVKKDGKISTLQGRLTSKHCAASALLDNRDNMKQQTLNAAIKQGMTLKTNMTAICDGAANCWDIVDSLEKQCNSLERILDWHHIAMKFQNTRLGQNDMNTKLSGAKWYLWHGLPDKAIERLRLIRDDLKKDKKQQTKVQLLLTYIENNSNYIVNYENRQNSGLIFTSQMAESTVESLINQRCKGQQHMRWSREGLHALLQIRATVNSNDWNMICESHINDSVYRKVA